MKTPFQDYLKVMFDEIKHPESTKNPKKDTKKDFLPQNEFTQRTSPEYNNEPSEPQPYSDDYDSGYDTDMENYKCYYIGKNGPSNAVTDITINGVKFSAVIDTGAQITVVSTNVLNKLHGKVKLGKTVMVRGFSSEFRKEGKLAKVKIGFGKHIVKQEVVIINSTDDVLLGIDFITQNKINLDFDGMLMSSKSSSIPLYLREKKTASSNQIRLVKTEIFEPYTAKTVNCEMDVNDLEQNILLEPSDSIHKLSFAPGIFENRKTVQLTIHNFSPAKMKLPPGAIIGQAYNFETLNESEKSGDKPTNFSCNQTSQETLDPEIEEIYHQLPEHMRTLFLESGENIAISEHVKIGLLLLEFLPIFSENKYDLGLFNGPIEHEIPTKDDIPVREPYRRTPLKYQAELNEHIQKLMEADLIEPSNSPYASATLCVRKKCKEGEKAEIRLVQDFRKLNDKSVISSFPLPNINDVLNALAGTETKPSKLFSSLDLTSCFWQIKMSPKDAHKTAFLSQSALYQWIRMSQGLSGAPSTCSRVISYILDGLLFQKGIYSGIAAYIDDIQVASHDFENHLLKLRAVFLRMQQYDMKLNPKKCKLLASETEFLGKNISGKGISITDNKIQAIREWPLPKTQRQLHQFLGFCNFCRHHMKDYADLSADLYQLLDVNRPSYFPWTKEHTKMFETLKTKLSTAPTLSYPHANGKFILYSDASDKQIAGVLYQMQNNEERLIGCASNILTPAQRNYCATKKELLALVKMIQHYDHLLIGQRFLAKVDHQALCFLLRFKKPQGLIARWLMYLGEFCFDIVHVKGTETPADAPSRQGLPEGIKDCDCYNAGTDITKLPCYPCKFCEKIYKQWKRYENEIDDILPLSYNEVRDHPEIRALSWDLDIDLDPDTVLNDLITEEKAELEKIPQNTVDYSAAPELDNVNFQDENYLTPYTKADLRNFQLNDPDIWPIMSWLENKIEPTPGELHTQSRSTKWLWNCKKFLVIRKGILFYKFLDCPLRDIAFVVPRKLKDFVLALCHDAKTSGHFGEKYTLQRLRRSFIFYNMADSAIQYVKTCDLCIKNKPFTRTPRAPLKIDHAGYVGEKVYLDIVGPISKSESKNRYIATMIDDFSGWVELAAIPDTTAVTVAQKVVDHYISRFGTPCHLQTDRSTVIDGDLMRALCDLLEIHKGRSTSYRPQTQGCLERKHRVLAAVIRCFINGRYKKWDEDLQLVAMALRSMPQHNKGGLTAEEIMLGRSTHKPLDIIFGLNVEPRLKLKPHEWVKSLQHRLEYAYDLVRKFMGPGAKRMKRDYDRYANVNKYEPGDIVYVFDDGYEQGVSKKLKNRFKGPFVIEDNSNPPVLKIKFPKKSDNVHHDKIRLAGGRYTPLRVLKDRHEILYPDKPFSASEAQKMIKSKALVPPDIEKKVTKKSHKPQPLKVIPDTDLDATLPYDVEKKSPRKQSKHIVSDLDRLKDNIKQHVNKYKWPIKLKLGKSNHEYFIIPQEDHHQVSTPKRHSTKRRLSNKQKVSKMPDLSAIKEIEPIKLKLDKSKDQYVIVSQLSKYESRVTDPLLVSERKPTLNTLTSILEQEEPVLHGEISLYNGIENLFFDKKDYDHYSS